MWIAYVSKWLDFWYSESLEVKSPMICGELRIHPDVQAAKVDGKPVVALESTIIAHGMPYPRNVETAIEIQDIIRAEGATPAIIAILDGQMCAGLDMDDIDRLGNATKVAKASRRDIPVFLANRKMAATTVSATMIGAAWAGLSVFATGGIGGVHRGAASTFDISADLQELARTSVAVVSAGAKAILDLPLTLEYLETLGVPIVGIRTSEFPAFYSRESGLKLEHRVENEEEAAQIMDAKWSSGLDGGILFANPIPLESEIPKSQMDGIISIALEDAEREGVRGARMTPYLLARIVQLTQGQSLTANIALAKHNARIAARISCAYTSIIKCRNVNLQLRKDHA